MSKSERIEKVLAAKFGNVEAAPGYIASVVIDGELAYQKSAGLANLETSDSVTPDTHFRLASVAKQFTAMCIVLLREQGKLSMDDRLVSIYPDFPAYGRNITIRHLLSHTSGLQAYESLMPPDIALPLKDHDVLELVKGADSTYFDPGSEFRYSNSGYAVLATIIEKISGERFPDFLKKHIFDPLEMGGTVAHEEGRTTVPNRAAGYKHHNDKWHYADQNMTSYVLGDGGIYCSMNNYLKWSAALESEQLVSRELINEIWSPAKLNDGSDAPYGIGWRLDLLKEHLIPYHPGSTTGFNNYTRRIRHKNTVFTILSNRSGRHSHDAALEIDQILSSHAKM